MYNLIESLRSALNSIRAHGFRSFLTSLGIIIGVAAVIAIVSIVQGLSFYINQQFEGLGSNSLTVRSDTPFKDQLQGKFAKLTNDDMLAIQEQVDGISFVTPILIPGRHTTVRFGAQVTATQVFGTTSSWQDLNGLFTEKGRFIARSDDLSRRPVCVIGEKVREDLELPEDPTGSFVQYGGEWLKVIGVMEQRGELFGFSQDDFVLMPYSTARRIRGASVNADIQVQLLVDDLNQIDEISDRIKRVLRTEHNLKRGAPDDFKVQTASQLTESFNAITDTITYIAGGIVGISLLVGGIGIMNIMLVSVTERTREIGICKALGATRGNILMQFLIEATTLCMLGGLVGLLLGYGLGALVATMLPGFPAAHVPLWAVLLSFGFSAFVGILFGIIPAAKAANLDPIEALRFE